MTGKPEPIDHSPRLLRSKLESLDATLSRLLAVEAERSSLRMRWSHPSLEDS